MHTIGAERRKRSVNRLHWDPACPCRRAQHFFLGDHAVVGIPERRCGKL